MRFENRGLLFVEPGLRCLRRSRGVLLVALAATLGTGALLYSPEARAQTNTTGITLDPANIDRDYFRTNKSRTWWVSYADCIADDVISFPLKLTNTSDVLEVWAGNQDCVTIRGNTDRGQCWLLQTEPNVGEMSLRVNVPVRNIVAHRTNTLDLPMGGFPETVCDESKAPAGTKFSFYFLQQNGGTAVTSTKWDGGTDGAGFDMIGPAPPGSISVGMGDEELTLNVKGVNTDADRVRFAAYCAPAESTSVAADGSARCTSPELVSGVRPVIASCGQADEASGAITAKKLDNDVTYVVGVAGEDIIGNAGPLSQTACGTPKPLDDFFELYTDAGGAGGGGFCSVSPRGLRAAPGATLLLGVALAALAARRGRSRS